MASITITKTNECATGDHVRLSVTGDATYTLPVIYLPDVTEPVTDEEKDIFIRVLLKLGKKTRTAAQMKSLVTAGWTVTI